GAVACFRTGGIWGLSSSSSEYRPFGARPFSTLLEAGEVQIARYVDGLWIRPARRGSGHKSAKEKITYMTGSKLALNTIRRRVSTIRVFYDWCIRVRKRHDQLNPVPRGVRGKERGFVSYAPQHPGFLAKASSLICFCMCLLRCRCAIRHSFWCCRPGVKIAAL